MKMGMIWTTFVVAVFGGSQVLAQETLVEHLVAACESDIENYCSQVTPGNGRLLHCMAAHEDKISGKCEYAFYQASSVLEQLSVAIRYFVQECKTEIETLCSDVAMGDGKMLACLDSQKEKVGKDCQQAIADTVGK